MHTPRNRQLRPSAPNLAGFRNVEADALADYELASEVELTAAAALVVFQGVRDGILELRPREVTP